MTGKNKDCPNCKPGMSMQGKNNGDKDDDLNKEFTHTTPHESQPEKAKKGTQSDKQNR